MNPTLTRQEFLAQVGALGAATLLAPLTSEAAPAERKIKVAMIGCGSVSNMYLPHLSKSLFVELVATCDIIPERAQRAALTYKIANHYPHIDCLLAGVPFELLVNLTNMQEHERLNRQALLAGKHVWSEKPMANSYRAGRELLDLAIQKTCESGVLRRWLIVRSSRLWHGPSRKGN